MQAALTTLREALCAADYNQDSVRRTLGINHPDDIGALNRVAAILRLADDSSALATALRLFFLEQEESLTRANRLLSPAGVRRLSGIGLLRRRGDRVLARLRVETVASQLFLADRRFHGCDLAALHLSAARAGQRIDPVYPPSSDSILLHEAISTIAGGTLLDLCTGSGMQAIAQSSVAGPATAVDINPRAVAVARLNAALNQVEDLDVRHSDLYRGLGRARFDTIIANPPFVSSPYQRGPSYHAGGATGDALLRRILRGWTTYLAAHGRGFAITHVGLRIGHELAQVSESWFRGFPGRVLVLELESGSPVDLAAAQALFALERGIAAYAREAQRWVEYLKRNRISRIAALLIVAEKAGTPAVEVIDAHPRVLPLPLSPPPAQRVSDWLAVR